MLKRSRNKIAGKFVDKDEHLNADEMRSEESSYGFPKKLFEMSQSNHAICDI